MLECVINISEGRDGAVIDAIAAAAGDALLDRHTDPHHHRTVLTVAGSAAARAVAARTVALVDVSMHTGVHPRIGAVDVVPFVPLHGSTMAEAVEARDAFATWLSATHGVPCFLYGPERSLPDVRRSAFTDLMPDTGPHTPHPTAGACAVGARDVLIAYNVWLVEPDVDAAQRIAAELRGPQLRTLALRVGPEVQVSMNLISPDAIGPLEAYDLVAARAPVRRAELVGLVPSRVLERTPRARWEELDLDEDTTIEARLARTRLGHGGDAVAES